MDTVCGYLFLPEKMDSLTPSRGPKGLTKIVQLNLIQRTKYVISFVLLKFVQSNPQMIDFRHILLKNMIDYSCIFLGLALIMVKHGKTLQRE